MANAEPMRLIEFIDDRDPDKVPTILETPTREATIKQTVIRANKLARTGTVRIIWAGTPAYWKTKLARALFFGFGVGVLVSVLVNLAL